MKRLARFLRANGLALVAAAMYAVSFAVPVLNPTSAAHGIYGYECFRYGLDIAAYLPTWTANPVFWLALVLAATGQTRAASRLAMVAAGLATYGFVWWTRRVVPSGTSGLLAGYWLWFGSMVTLAFADFAAQRSRSPANASRTSHDVRGHA